MILRRIAWQSKITNFKDGGHWMEYREFYLEAICRNLNLKYPDINHWVETWTRRMN